MTDLVEVVAKALHDNRCIELNQEGHVCTPNDIDTEQAEVAIGAIESTGFVIISKAQADELKAIY